MVSLRWKASKGEFRDVNLKDIIQGEHIRLQYIDWIVLYCIQRQSHREQSVGPTMYEAPLELPMALNVTNYL